MNYMCMYRFANKTIFCEKESLMTETLREVRGGGAILQYLYLCILYNVHL